MSTTISIDFNAEQILEARGLGQDKRAQQFFCNEVFRMSDPYAPMDQGTLKSNVSLEADGSGITYNSPYAAYQFYGKVMTGQAPKQITDKDLTYQGAPIRGMFWTQRMFANRGDEIIKSVENFINNKSK